MRARCLAQQAWWGAQRQRVAPFLVKYAIVYVFPYLFPYLFPEFPYLFRLTLHHTLAPDRHLLRASARRSTVAVLLLILSVSSTISMAALKEGGCFVVSMADISAARDRIRPFGIRETPMHSSTTMDTLSGHELFFKCELFQRTGSFKARGATNAAALCPPGMPMVTHSSGNHAQALAFAARATGRAATIVMPNNAPAPKRAATEGYGATLRLVRSEDRASAAALAAEELGAELVHPSEDPRVIAGQGTVALEALEQVASSLGMTGHQQPLDVLVIPVGGGGLLSGCAVCCKTLWPELVVVGAEPLAMNDACRSKRAGELQGNKAGATTIADGLRTQVTTHILGLIKLTCPATTRTVGPIKRIFSGLFLASSALTRGQWFATCATLYLRLTRTIS